MIIFENHIAHKILKAAAIAALGVGAGAALHRHINNKHIEKEYRNSFKSDIKDRFISAGFFDVAPHAIDNLNAKLHNKMHPNDKKEIKPWGPVLKNSAVNIGMDTAQDYISRLMAKKYADKHHRFDPNRIHKEMERKRKYDTAANLVLKPLVNKFISSKINNEQD